MFRKSIIAFAVIGGTWITPTFGSMVCSSGSGVGNGDQNTSASTFLSDSYKAAASNSTLVLDFTVEHRANQGFVVSLGNGVSTYAFAYGSFNSALPKNTDNITSWLNSTSSITPSVIPDPFDDLTATFSNMCFSSAQLGVSNYALAPTTMNSGDALVWALSEFKNYGSNPNWTVQGVNLRPYNFTLNGRLTAPIAAIPAVPEPGTIMLLCTACLAGLRRSPVGSV